MPYASQTDLEQRVNAATLLRLLDDDNDGVVDNAALASVLASGDAEVNGYVGQVYPVTTLVLAPPPVLVSLAADVAVQLAYLRRPEILNERGETPWEGRYKLALTRLREINTGKFRLDVNGTPALARNLRGAGLYTSTGPADPTDPGFVKDGSGDF